eukprot:gene21011-32377_t
MKVITVGGVVIRAQHHIEILAGAVAHLPQEARTLAVTRPILEHTDGAPVRQAKPGDIQRIGRRMLAESPVGAVVDIATGKAAQVIDPRHCLAKHRLGRWLQAMALEQGERHGQRATGEKAAAQADISALDPQRVTQRASRVGRAVRLMGDSQPGGLQHLVT